MGREISKQFTEMGKLVYQLDKVLSIKGSRQSYFTGREISMYFPETVKLVYQLGKVLPIKRGRQSYFVGREISKYPADIEKFSDDVASLALPVR